MISQLQKLGLTDKEAKVYLAVLELGPSPVQKIAQRAEVPRATTYLVLDDLQNKGLVTTHTEGKKVHFTAASPEHLNDLINQQKKTIEERSVLLQTLMPGLLQRTQKEQNKRPTVRYYEGASGVKSSMRDIIKAPGKEIINFFCHDDVETAFKKTNITWQDIIKHRKQAKTKHRAIYTWHSKAPAPGRHNPKFTKYIPYAQLPLTADIEVKGRHVAFTPYNEPLRAVIIEDEAIAKSISAIFNALWQQPKSKK